MHFTPDGPNSKKSKSKPRLFQSSPLYVRDKSKSIQVYSRHLFVPFLVLLLVYLAASTIVRADAITGTVKDTSAGVVAGARVEISGETLAQPIVLATDDAGKFS